jgi:phosphoribosylglycinamide formyltransferase-1
VVQWFCEKRLTMETDNAVLDGQVLPKQGATI